MTIKISEAVAMLREVEAERDEACAIIDAWAVLDESGNHIRNPDRPSFESARVRDLGAIGEVRRILAHRKSTLPRAAISKVQP